MDHVRCRSCGGHDGRIVLDLGRQPSCERFALLTEPAPDPRHPLRMWLCGRCGLAQLAEDPGVVEEQVVVVESQALIDQQERTLAFAAAHGLLRPGARVAEFGSPHGGSMLPELARRGLCPVGVDSPPGGVDLLLDVYGLLHEPDAAAALRRRAVLLAPGGALLVQMHSLGSVMAARQVGELRHGHFGYWSLPALQSALQALGLGIRRARCDDHDGGTSVLLVTRGGNPDPAALALIEAERRLGVLDPQEVGVLQREVDRAARGLVGWLTGEREAGRRVFGYGAATRAIPLLCHAGVDRSLLTAVGDAAPGKWNRRLPGTGIPVVRPERIVGAAPDRVVLFVPDLLAEMRARLPQIERRGGSWVVLRPDPMLIGADGTERPAGARNPVPAAIALA